MKDEGGTETQGRKGARDGKMNKQTNKHVTALLLCSLVLSPLFSVLCSLFSVLTTYPAPISSATPRSTSSRRWSCRTSSASSSSVVASPAHSRDSSSNVGPTKPTLRQAALCASSRAVHSW